jgi:hypothetical protein
VLTPPAAIKGGPAAAEEKHLLIRRIAASDLFTKAPRLRDFFLYAAECTLENRLADVREQVIAERVFKRSFDVHGGQDSIVRAEARNLRKRLETYFESEGKDEPVIVTMPKGGYALAFQPRDLNAKADSKNAAALPAPTESGVTNAPTSLAVVAKPISAEKADPRLRLYRGALVALGAFAIAMMSLAFYWRSAETRLAGELHIQPPMLPFSALFSTQTESIIVTSDTGLMQISSLAHRRISLDEYIARSYPRIPNIEPPWLIANWNIWEFTDGREMTLASEILRSNVQFSQRISMLSGHKVQLHDFKNKSAILIGSPVSNPWAQLYEEKLNFHCELGANDRILFKERLASGAIRQYPNEDDIRHNRTYARIAFIPGTSDASPALLLAGTTAQSTEAAGELVLNRERMAQTLRSISVDPSGPPHFFEILIRSNDFVGGAILPEVVAWRIKPAPEV